MRNLLLLRHAKAKVDSRDGTDFSRPLADKGQRHAKAVASWLTGNLPAPEVILCSTAVRAKETAEPVIHAYANDNPQVHYEKALYGASTERLRQISEDFFKTRQRIMLVGHNPGFEWFLAWLSPQPLAQAGLATGTLAVLEFDDKPLTRGCAKLLHKIRGKELLQNLS